MIRYDEENSDLTMLKGEEWEHHRWWSKC